MKKNWFKKLLCAGLALTMAMPLAACGGDSGKTANATLAKENVYRVQEFQMPDLGSTDTYVCGSAHKDGMLYLLVQVYNYDKMTANGSDTEIKLVSMKDDGADAKVVTLEMPESESSVVEGGTAEDGTTGDTASGESSASDGGAVVMPREEVSNDNVWENTDFSNYVMGSDGKIYAVKDYYFSDYDNGINVSEQYICSWKTDGTFEREVKLEGLRTDEEWIGIRNMTVAQDGTVNLILSGNTTYKMSIDSQGKLSGKKEVSEELAKVFNNSGNILSQSDGKLLVFYYDENDWAKQYITTYDPTTDAVSEGVELPSSISWGGYQIMVTGVSSDLLYATSTGVYSYNVGDPEPVLKMSFINSDVNVTSVRSLVELDEKKLLCVFNENYGDVQAGIFTYVDPSEIADKPVVVLAGMYVPGEMKQRIVEHNRSSEDYRIVVKEYNSYNSYDDYEGGYTQLNNDIITGGMPDILIADNLPVEKYISKGLLADVGKMIEKDEELSGVEFMQNVMDAYSVDGKLYYVIPTFRVQTVIGKKSILGDRSTWTMKDMQDLAASLPEGTDMFGGITRDSFLSLAMDYCGGDFIDVSTGKCNFNSEGFIGLMEYAKTLPEELGEDYYGEDYWMNYESQYRDERTILYNLYISSFSNLNYQINGYFGEAVSYIGFPTESGQGSYVATNMSYVLSSKSKNLDEAWDFIRYYLTDEYQSAIEYELPIQKKYFKEVAQRATKRPYYINADGTKEEYDETIYLNGESIPLPPMSQEQVDGIVAFVESVNKKYYSNTDVLNIINEEIPAFYSGQKTAQEVAKIIQSRAEIFVQENQ